MNREGQQAEANAEAPNQWERLRDKWEYSHVVRAGFAAIGLISVTLAVALYGRR